MRFLTQLRPLKSLTKASRSAINYFALGVALTLCGCATTQKTSFYDSAKTIRVSSAYLVTFGGKSTEMDRHLQEALRARGLSVKTGPDVHQTKDTDILVKYSDGWRWDVVMYLQNLSVTFYDGKTGDLIATGTWDNSVMHKFRKPEVVIKGIFDELFAKIKVAH